MNKKELVKVNWLPEDGCKLLAKLKVNLIAPKDP